MAPNGTTSRKTPAAAPRPIKTEEASTRLASLFDDLENEDPSVGDDMQQDLLVLEKPGNWESKVTPDVKTSTETPIIRTSPAMSQLPKDLGKSFPKGKVLGDKPETDKCQHCKRPVIKHAMPGHIERCLSKKQEKQRKKKEAKDARDAAARKDAKDKGQGDSDAEGEDDGSAGKKTAAGKGGGLTASKKRKAADEGEEGAPTKKKKKKDLEKAKNPKAKAPVDVEKQCGVELPQGGQCARSLTCKSHSMGAKRAVPGRSAPYDKLLMEYQRKNQAKLQKAAFDANAPDPDDDALPTGPVDSEEEKDAIMSAIARSWGGKPIYQPIEVPLQSKYKFNRVKGMLSSAIGNTNRGGGLFGNAGGGTGFFGNAIAAPAASAMDVDGSANARRGSVVPGARSMMAPSAARKSSIAAS